MIGLSQTRKRGLSVWKAGKRYIILELWGLRRACLGLRKQLLGGHLGERCLTKGAILSPAEITGFPGAGTVFVSEAFV